ncbi:DUF2079 domain-containing protein [Actinomyces marmotae]|uniref:DUF2079 domain-containing protein n=1 Tax=Actinomyces marmotae TaxID=2737173 RepID=UPI001F48E60B|nr:DUF2079 domain-containing protein [Actinomyces marmotae]
MSPVPSPDDAVPPRDGAALPIPPLPAAPPMPPGQCSPPDAGAPGEGAGTTRAIAPEAEEAPPFRLTPPRSFEDLRDLLPAALTVLIGAWVLISYSVGQWRAMTVPSWDLGIFSEAAKAYSQLNAPIVPIKGPGYNLLGDHFHPILVLLGPLWALFPSGLTLLIVQDLLLAVSAWPIVRLAQRLTQPVVALALGLTYVLSWGFQGAVAAQFHEIAFAVPMLAFASAAFVERRWLAVACWSAPLVLVKEDLGLTVLMIGLAVTARGLGELRRGRLVRPLGRLATWQLGLALATFGVIMFFLTTMVLLPMLNPDGSWAYSIGSGSDSGAHQDLLTRLFSPEVKIQTLVVLALTAGLIGLGSPWIAVVAPTLAWRFLGSVAFYWEWKNWHYNAVLIPVAIGALLDVVAALKRRRSRRPEGPGWLAAPLWARWLALLGLATPMLLGAVTASDLPLWQMNNRDFGKAPERLASVKAVYDLIPEGSTVETDLSLMAYLVPRADVAWVGTGREAPQYVVIDARSSAWGGNAPRDAAAWIEGRTGRTYALIFNKDDLQVARLVDTR